MALPSAARALLAHKLITSLDESFEQDLDQVWLAEAQRRDAEISLGKVTCRTAEEVIRDAYLRIGCSA